jgi:hypothetical protein
MNWQMLLVATACIMVSITWTGIWIKDNLLAIGGDLAERLDRIEKGLEGVRDSSLRLPQLRRHSS